MVDKTTSYQAILTINSMLPLPNFEDISYLQTGSLLQQRAYTVIVHSKILYHLKPFRPVLTGTLPLDIFLEEKSDLDIICTSPELGNVEKTLHKFYNKAAGFSVERKTINTIQTLLCRFSLEGFAFEIFCQPEEPVGQAAYRHMVIEFKILQRHGLEFKNRILTLKRSGLKTEPAFAKLLGLKGDPYEALLQLSDESINNSLEPY
jgi:hypothetical protein